MKLGEGFKLLVVDDNRHNLFSLRQLIERHLAVTLLEASGGAEALEVAQAEPDIDLLLLDVQMPEVDGFQTARMLKARRKTRDIPIIFLTAAFKTAEFQQRGYAVGAVDYLLKPIDDNLLINKLCTYFRLIDKERSLNRTLERQVAERTRQLAEAKRHLEGVLAAMGEALLLLDPAGDVQQVNPRACQMLGYPEAELIGMNIGDLFEESDDAEAGAFMGTWLEAVIRTGVLRDVDAAFRTKDGRRLPILFSRTALEDGEGGLRQIICIAKDMTGYRRVTKDDAERDVAT